MTATTTEEKGIEAKDQTIIPQSFGDIYEAVAWVMSQVGYVQKLKSGKVPYTYASEGALIKAIRPYLLTAGIVVHRTSIDHVETGNYAAKSGNLMHTTIIKDTWCWLHWPSKTQFFAASLGGAANSGDKSPYAAMTGSAKYNLRQTLLIETGDDPDQFSSEDQAGKAGSKEGNGNESRSGTTPDLNGPPTQELWAAWKGLEKQAEVFSLEVILPENPTFRVLRKAGIELKHRVFAAEWETLLTEAESIGLATVDLPADIDIVGYETAIKLLKDRIEKDREAV